MKGHVVLDSNTFIDKAIKGHKAAVDNVVKLLRDAKCSVDNFSETQLDFWAACSQIPKGNVATYTTLSKIVQGVRGEQYTSARLARTAGKCMADNPIAPVIPCHRVVGRNGNLTGYIFGLPQKAELLKSEGVPVANNTVDPRTKQIL